MSPIKEKWDNASPRLKRAAIVGSGFVVLIIILYLFVTATPTTQTKEAQRDSIVQNILTGADTRELGISGLGNRTHNLEGDVADLSRQLSELTKEVRKRNEKTHKSEVTSRELDTKIAQLRQALEQSIQAATRAPVAPAPMPDDSSDDGQDSDQDDGSPAEPEPRISPEIWQEQAPVSIGSDTATAGSQGGGDATASQINIRVIGEQADTADKDDEDATGEKTDVYMPAGSIITGVMVTGMDAPTNNSARSQPFPSLIRIKKSAILPNRYQLNVRECFVIASGYGDLSAERAYLRAETLSCVRNDGGVIEVALNAYAVGEDGKVGMRGRVVSKQGQMLAKSLSAGFFSGMSQVFNKAPIPTIQTSSNGKVQYQDVLSGDSLTSGVVKGASSAMDRLAEYYLDMAKNIFPVIEVNAGRKVDLIVTQGGWLHSVDGA